MLPLDIEYYLWYHPSMTTKKKKEGKMLMDKKFTITTNQEFIDAVSKARWVLKMNQSELIRNAVYEYLDKHLPKEVKEEILRKGR
jgi:hypothetical protein